MSDHEDPGQRTAWDAAAIGFRPLGETDFPLLQRWLVEPQVRRWWYDEPTDLAGVIAEYGPRLAPGYRELCFVITDGGRPVGYIQTYRLADWPDWEAVCALNEPAAGLDVLIGEGDHRQRGFGPVAMRRFLREIVFVRFPEVTCCVLDPEPENLAAIRAYERCGFRYLKTIHPPDDPPGYLMRVGRDEVPPE